MNRQEIIKEIMSMPEEVLMAEADIFVLCQSFWYEYNAFWDLLSEGEFTLATEALVNGTWTNDHLVSHLNQLRELSNLLKKV